MLGGLLLGWGCAAAAPTPFELANRAQDSEPAEAASPAMTFTQYAWREAIGAANTGNLRSILESVQERRVGARREIEITTDTIMVFLSAEQFRHRRQIARWTEEGPRLTYEVSPGPNRKVTIEIDGNRVAVRHEGALARVPNSLPETLEYPRILDEDLAYCYERVLQSVLQQYPTGALEVRLANRSFSAIVPKLLALREYTLRVVGWESASSKAPTLRLVLSRKNPEAGADAPTLDRHLWLNPEGRLVKIEVPKQGTMQQSFERAYLLEVAPERGTPSTTAGPGSSWLATPARSFVEPKPGPALLLLHDDSLAAQRVANRLHCELPATGVALLRTTRPLARIGPLLEWLRGRPEVDAGRVFVAAYGTRAAELCQALIAAPSPLASARGAALLDASGLDGTAEAHRGRALALSRRQVPCLLTWADGGDEKARDARREFAAPFHDVARSMRPPLIVCHPWDGLEAGFPAAGAGTEGNAPTSGIEPDYPDPLTPGLSDLLGRWVLGHSR